MAKSDKYDPNENPVSGPFAGLDPEQSPVIVDPMGQRVKDEEPTAHRHDPAFDDIKFDLLVNDLARLCHTHTVQIEWATYGNNLPVHRIVLGGDNFFPALAEALHGALAHHKEK